MSNPSHTKTLSSLSLNEQATVTSFTNALIEEKMMEMGCLPGSAVVIERIAPLGDPIMIKFEGTSLALRKEEAEHITVSVG